LLPRSNVASIPVASKENEMDEMAAYTADDASTRTKFRSVRKKTNVARLPA